MPQVLLLWELLWADAWQRRRRRRQSEQQQQQKLETNVLPPARQQPPPAGEAAAAAAAAAAAKADSSGAANTPDAVAAASSSGAADAFIAFVAAVVMGQRRAVLDHCRDADDVLALFHTPKRSHDVWGCVQHARTLLDEVDKTREECNDVIAATDLGA
jgi:hypothetical protein